jgi:hypothetical protein
MRQITTCERRLPDIFGLAGSIALDDKFNLMQRALLHRVAEFRMPEERIALVSEA